MLVMRDGSVWSTGVYSDAVNDIFVQIISSGATAPAVGNHRSIVLKQDGNILVAVKDSERHLDFFVEDTTSSQIIPRAKAIAVGGYHSMLMTNEGHLWASWAMERRLIGVIL